MTYLVKPQPRARRRRRSVLGDLQDEINKISRAGYSSDEIACLDQANASVAPLDARITDLQRTWNPTGYYTPADIARIIPEVVKICSAATSALAAAPLSTSDAQDQKHQALDTINQKLIQSVNYTRAAQEATAKGARAIDAPGLKAWVISTMNAASQGLVVAHVLQCNMSVLASLIIKFQGLFDTLAGVVKRIAGITLALGELAIKTVEEVPKLGSILITVAKWGAVGVAAAYALRKIKEARGR